MNARICKQGKTINKDGSAHNRGNKHAQNSSYGKESSGNMFLKCHFRAECNVMKFRHLAVLRRVPPTRRAFGAARRENGRRCHQTESPRRVVLGWPGETKWDGGYSLFRYCNTIGNGQRALSQLKRRSQINRSKGHSNCRTLYLFIFRATVKEDLKRASPRAEFLR